MHYLILWESCGSGPPRKSWGEVFVENDEQAVEAARKKCRTIVHIIRKDRLGISFVQFKAIFPHDISFLLAWQVPLPMGGQVWSSLKDLAGQNMTRQEAAQKIAEALQPISDDFELGGKIVKALFDSALYCDEMHRRVDALMGWSQNEFTSEITS